MLKYNTFQKYENNHTKNKHSSMGVLTFFTYIHHYIFHIYTSLYISHIYITIKKMKIFDKVLFLQEEMPHYVFLIIHLYSHNVRSKRKDS